jgi:hypothetical protein
LWSEVGAVPETLCFLAFGIPDNGPSPKPSNSLYPKFTAQLIKFSKVTPEVHPPHVEIVLKITCPLIILRQQLSYSFTLVSRGRTSAPSSPGTSHNIITKLVSRAAAYGTLLKLGIVEVLSSKWRLL